MKIVYAMQERDAVKIGRTERPIAQRMSQLQTGNPNELKVLGTIEGDAATERRLHQELAPWHRRREWFDLTVGVANVLRREGLLPAQEQARLPVERPLLQAHVPTEEERAEQRYLGWKSAIGAGIFDLLIRSIERVAMRQKLAKFEQKRAAVVAKILAGGTL